MEIQLYILRELVEEAQDAETFIEQYNDQIAELEYDIPDTKEMEVIQEKELTRLQTIVDHWIERRKNAVNQLDNFNLSVDEADDLLINAMDTRLEDEVIEAGLVCGIPVTAVEEAYVGHYMSDEEFAMETAESMGLLDGDSTWPHDCIDWERAARELMYDYVEEGGYYFRLSYRDRIICFLDNA